jgi:GT2 family glycosyltransferase
MSWQAPVAADARTARAPLCIVLLNYNGWRDTLACVDSLFASRTGFTQLIVCDNASPDGSLAELRRGLAERVARHAATWQRWHANAHGAALDLAELSKPQVDAGATSNAALVLIDNQANLGFARGNNVGLRLAFRRPDLQWFWLLNNDTEVRPDTIASLMSAATRRPEVDLWGCTVIYHAHPDTVQALGGGALNPCTAESRHLGAFTPVADVRAHDAAFVQRIEREMDYPLGAAMLASRAWLSDVGLLGEQYFLYYEELDWALRGRARHALGYAAEAWVFHKEGASIGTAPSGGSPFSVFHLHRSRLLFARLRLPRRTLPGVIARSLWQSVKMALKQQGPQARAAARGMWDGLTTPVPADGPAGDPA